MPSSRDRYYDRITHYTPQRVAPFNEANRRHPEARGTERRLMIELADPRPGMTIVDTMAGGGYLAEGIRARVGRRSTIVCVDPAPSFVDSIAPSLRRIVCGLDAISLGAGSADRVTNLAGIHHLEFKLAFFREAYRILKPGGVFAVADVRQGSPAARWLNGPVDRLSDIGHDGMFLAEGEVTDLLRTAGFVDVNEAYQQYTWNLPSFGALVAYCKDLFRLTRATADEVAAALLETLDIDQDERRATLGWGLTYARGTKAAH